MKRAGFTMIELIFVIVILGILAAVAVPKLAATRTDAAATAAVSDYKSAIKSITAEAMATGTMPDFTALFPVATGSYDADSATVLNVMSGTVICATITADGNATNPGSVLTPSFPNTTTPVCALMADEDTTPIQVLGTAVTR